MVTQEVQRRNAVIEILSESEALVNWVQKEAKKAAIPIAEKMAEKKAIPIAEKKLKQARQQAQQQTRHEERVQLLTRQLETLYGKLPKWANEKIAAAQTRTLEKWMMRLLKAKSLEEVLQ